MMSSMMSSGGRQDPPGQPAFSSDYLSGEGGGSAAYLPHSFHTSVSTKCAQSTCVVAEAHGGCSSPCRSLTALTLLHTALHVFNVYSQEKS